MVVVKVADQDVADKVDTQYIEDQLAGLQNIGIVFVCTGEGGDDDDWTDEEGVHPFVIHLPYKEVRETLDVRPLMLGLVKERLGMVG